MRNTRREIVAVFNDNGWSVSADSRRITFVGDDPPQVIIWHVDDSDLAHMQAARGSSAKGAYGSRKSNFGLLVHISEAIDTFTGTRGEMRGDDLTVIEQ
ncbi:hypothetical protein [Brevibacterium sp. 2SA]|uniref:hypothetical protein n=1 Tax=Brevibacterium sp. 2SA TaxID=2502198 RepID=UPI0010F8ABC0|nr:hypothetical protein [Brevibacterium sp. 2SA]